MTTSIEEYEKLDPVYVINWQDREIRFAVPNSQTLWRADTLLTKEPDTIEWIASFGADDVFIDIGANVGIYSIWAAITGAAKVYAFEPESQNFATLNKNIFLNALSGRVVAYCTALSDQAGFGPLYLSEFRGGASGHNFAVRPQRAEPKFTQGVYSTTLDDLVATGSIPPPRHIKIDVDGIEHKIIAGARRTLQDQRLASVLVELDTNLETHRNIIDVMQDLGFTLSPEQVEKAIRRTGGNKGVGNHIFRR